MSETLRVGVIGCGAMGQAHLRVWQNVTGARVVAVCDTDAQRAQETAALLGATPFTTPQAMAESGLIDAVDVCTPSGLHAEQGLVCAAQGKHILIEKPIDLNIQRVDRLIAECEARGLVLACMLQQRTFPIGLQVKEAIEAGKLGRLLSCSAAIKWWRSPEYYSSSAWRGTWAMDGGVLANQGIHTLDMLCWLVGGVAEVEYAHLESANHAIEAEDNALAVLRFENGARGVMEATTCAYPDLCTRIEIVGTRGSVAFDSANVVTFGYDGADRRDTLKSEVQDAGGGRSNPMAISLNAHTAIAQDFVGAIREQREPIVSGRMARVSLDALTKIYRKAYPNIVLGRE